MSRTKVLTTVCVILLTAPALVFLGNASAQDPVPIATGISWSTQVSHTTKLYLTFPNVTSPSPPAGNIVPVETPQPDCRARGESAPPLRATLGLYPMPSSLNSQQVRAACTFTAFIAGDPSGTTPPSFETAPVSRDFNLSGNDALTYVHHGRIPANVNLTVDVMAGGSTIGSVVIPGADGDPTAGTSAPMVFTFNVPLNGGAAWVRKDQALRVVATGTINDGTGPSASWTLQDTGSHLLVRSSDSHRASTWTTDPTTGGVKSLFKPYLDKNVTPPEGVPRIMGAFAIQSAFGLDDAKGFGVVPPTFLLVQGERAQPVGKLGNGVINATFNQSASPSSEGRAVWNFEEALDYRGLAAGEYNLTVRMDYHQGGAYLQGTTARILLSAPGVSLKEYDDDPLTSPSPLENLGHGLPPGGQTTYLLLVNNTGSATDTFRLSTSAVSSSPGGWAATLAGPTVIDNTVRLAPQEAALVTVTVQAPASAGVGAQSIFQVNAQSALDANARPETITLISTVTNEVRHEVGIISPLRPIEAVAGKSEPVAVYAWNRGTRPANLSLEIRSTTDWTEQFQVGDSTARRIVLPNVQPGAIARADLRVTPPENVGASVHDVAINASDTDVGGVTADALVHFFTSPSSSILVRVLESINGVTHDVEVTGQPGSPPAAGAPNPCVGGPLPGVCDENPDDGVDGTWFRVWITNTGKQADKYTMSIDSIQPTANLQGAPPCQDQVFVPTTVGDSFGIFYRDAQGGRAVQYDATRPITLQPGETGEVYVWRSADRSQDPCAPAGKKDTFSFALNVKGESGATGRASMVATAVNENDDTRAVLLEGVTRLNYTADTPIVDVSQANSRIVSQVTRPGENRTFYVRATIGSNFATYQPTSGSPRSTDVQLILNGVDREHGWNVVMRNVTGVTDTSLNPYLDSIWIANNYTGKKEAFVDREIEVVVTPPTGQNNSALAGEQNQFSIQAIIPGADTSTINTLNLKTVIGDFADVNVSADQKHIYAHPDEPSPYLLYVNNTGSSETLVTLRAKMNANATSNPNAWIVEPSSTTFPLQAFKNRTLALAVRPPPGASPGTTGQVDVSLEYLENPFDARTLKTPKPLELVTEVAAPGSLRLTAAQTEAVVSPGGFANFTLTLAHAGGGAGGLEFGLTSTQLPNWTQQIAPAGGIISPGESRTVVYVLKAPADVVNESSFSTIVRVSDKSNPTNFANVPLQVSILGGRPIPSLSVPKILKTVDRNGATNYEILVKNVGSASGRIVLSTRTADPAWIATVVTPAGTPVSYVDLGANDATLLNVSVRAPLFVPDHTIVPIDVFAETGTQSARVSLQAAVHDYGVHVELAPSRIDAIAGLPTEWTIKLRNDGNDNDTLNVSAVLQDIPDWTVSLATDRLRLEPGQLGEIRALVKPPTSPLPIPRAYTLKFYAGTVGGASLGIAKNETVAGLVNVLNYRAADVDKDDLLELAVDYDKNPANGFERFVEIFPDGAQSTVVALGKVGGKTNFFLDVPKDRPYDGIADVWFDPESVYIYDVKSAPDANGDNAPDYLLDTDHDGKVDKAFDTVSQSFWNAVEVRAYGDNRVQYLVDVTNDGKPDRFFDPGSKLVTRTQSVAGETNLVGLDTNNDQRIDKYYDIRANTVRDAKVFGFLDFVQQYWYFFVVFLAMVVLTVVLVARRKRVG